MDFIQYGADICTLGEIFPRVTLSARAFNEVADLKIEPVVYSSIVGCISHGSVRFAHSINQCILWYIVGIGCLKYFYYQRVIEIPNLQSGRRLFFRIVKNTFSRFSAKSSGPDQFY